MTATEICHLQETITSLSDTQFDLLWDRFSNLGGWEFGKSVPTLAGRHPYLKAIAHPQDSLTKSRHKQRNANTGPDKRSQEWVSLQRLIHKLPPETFYNVKQCTLDAAFLGDIYPLQRNGVVVSDYCIDEDINLKALGTLNRAIQTAYANRVWSENRWVIGPGPALPYREFFGFPEDFLQQEFRRML